MHVLSIKGSPQDTHLKATLFGERYTTIFSRHITAAKIHLAHLVYQTVERNATKLTNEPIRSYGLALFFMTHLLARILETDRLGRALINEPVDYVKNPERLRLSLKTIWDLLAPEINAFIDDYSVEQNNFFDYKNVFKNREFVDNATRKIKADNERILVRHPEDAFERIYTTQSAPVQ